MATNVNIRSSHTLLILTLQRKPVVFGVNWILREASQFYKSFGSSVSVDYFSDSTRISYS